MQLDTTSDIDEEADLQSVLCAAVGSKECCRGEGVMAPAAKWHSNFDKFITTAPLMTAGGHVLVRTGAGTKKCSNTEPNLLCSGPEQNQKLDRFDLK